MGQGENGRSRAPSLGPKLGRRPECGSWISSSQREAEERRWRIERGKECRRGSGGSGSEVGKLTACPTGSEVDKLTGCPTGSEVGKLTACPTGSEVGKLTACPTGSEVDKLTACPTGSEVDKLTAC